MTSPTSACDQGPSEERRGGAARSWPTQAGLGASDRLPAVLRRIAAELVDLHEKMLGLQHALGPVLAAAAEDGGTVMAAAQGLDLMSQSLDGLATFVDALGREGRSLDRLDPARAAAHVKLDGLASRLAGHVQPRADAADEGDLELF